MIARAHSSILQSVDAIACEVEPDVVETADKAEINLVGQAEAPAKGPVGRIQRPCTTAPTAGRGRRRRSAEREIAAPGKTSVLAGHNLQVAGSNPTPAIPPGAPNKASRVVVFRHHPAPDRMRKSWSNIGFGKPSG